MSVAGNLERVLEGVQRAAAGRPVNVLGVTKGQSLETVRQAVALGLTHLGNNYVQEGERLRSLLPEFQGKWHFIGHVQSRKARHLLDYDLVESVDRVSLAEELSKRSQGRATPLSCLLEVNVGGEVTKSGFVLDAVRPALEALAELPGIRVEGLMALPPPLFPVEERRPFFVTLRRLFDSCRDDFRLSVLSMGTSDDFTVAVEEGSTEVRLGTILFGARALK